MPDDKKTRDAKAPRKTVEPSGTTRARKAKARGKRLTELAARAAARAKAEKTMMLSISLAALECGGFDEELWKVQDDLREHLGMDPIERPSVLVKPADGFEEVDAEFERLDAAFPTWPDGVNYQCWLRFEVGGDREFPSTPESRIAHETATLIDKALREAGIGARTGGGSGMGYRDVDFTVRDTAEFNRVAQPLVEASGYPGTVVIATFRYRYGKKDGDTFRLHDLVWTPGATREESELDATPGSAGKGVWRIRPPVGLAGGAPDPIVERLVGAGREEAGGAEEGDMEEEGASDE